MAINKTPNPIRVKDYSYQDWAEQDDKDFHVRTIRDENLFDSAGNLDSEREFARDMFDLSNADDLPDSDRAQNCRSAGISRDECFNG